jgi:glycosyltransferase involved in cell wall biosynthesis
MKNGVSSVIYTSAEELKKRGYDIYIFTIKKNSKLNNYSIQHYNYNNIYSIRNYIYKDNIGLLDIKTYKNKNIEKAYIQYLEELNPDIIHFHAMQEIGVNLIKLTKERRVRTILTMHDWWWICPRFFMTNGTSKCNQLIINTDKCKDCLECTEEFLIKRNLYLEQILSQYVDKIICVSNYLKKFIVSNFPSLRSKISTIENPIKVDKERFQRAPLMPTKPIEFGFVGGVSEIKGYNLVLETFKQIQKGNWKLNIYGVDKLKKSSYINRIINIYRNSGSIYEFIKHLMYKLNKYKEISTSNINNIEFFPSYTEEEKSHILRNIDVLIIASLVNESYSLVAREALFYECIVITTDCGGPEEIIEDRMNGIVIRKNYMESLKKIVNEIVYNPEEFNMYNKKDVKIPLIEEQVNILDHMYKSR